jgi:phosphate transport system substrate-binding protein
MTTHLTQRPPLHALAWMLLFAAMPIFVLFAAAAQAGPPVIRFGGTGSGTALLEALAAQFAKERPEIHLESFARAMGSTGALRALDKEKIDLAVLGRPLGSKEAADNLRVFLWANTPLVLATSDGRLGRGMTPSLFIDILANRLTTWDDGARIRLVLRFPKDAETLILADASPEIKNALNTRLADPATVTADTDLDALGLLAATPGSLGPTTLGLMRLTESPLIALPWNQTPPELKNLANGRYPFSKNLYLAYKNTPSPALAAFLDWLKSPLTVQRLLELDFQTLFR